MGQLLQQQEEVKEEVMVEQPLTLGESVIVPEESTKEKFVFSKKSLFLCLFLVLVLLIVGSFSAYTNNTKSTIPSPISKPVFPQSQDIPIDVVLSSLNKEEKTNVKPSTEKSSAETSSTERTTPALKKINDEIFSVGGSQGTRIQDIQLELPQGTSQSKNIFSVFAQDTSTVPLYPIRFGNYSRESAIEIARKFDIQAEPQTLDQYNKMLFTFLDADQALVVGANKGGFDYYKRASGKIEKPDENQALAVAKKFMEEKGYSEKEYSLINTAESFFSSDDTVQKQKMVHGEVSLDLNWRDQWGWSFIFRKNLDNMPVGNLHSFPGFYDLYIAVGPGLEVLRLSDPLHAYHIDKEKDVLPMKRKTLEEASREVLQTGGLVMDLTPSVPEGNEYSKSIILSGESSGYEIGNAVITEAKLEYYLSTNGNYLYSSDTQQYAVGYLLPVWIFKGKGKIVHGELGNIDYSGFETGFTTAVYAFAELAQSTQPLFQISNMTSSANVVSTGSAITTSFSFSYMKKDTPIRTQIVPERGLKYTVTVIYPNGEYMQKTDIIRFSGYEEKFVIPSRSEIGDIRIIYSLTDFPSTSSEQIIHVEPEAPQAEGSLVVRISNTKQESLIGYTVNIRNMQIQGVEKQSIADQDPEHPEVPSLSAAVFRNIPVGGYSVEVFDLEHKLFGKGTAIVTSPRQVSAGENYRYDTASVWKQL